MPASSSLRADRRTSRKSWRGAWLARRSWPVADADVMRRQLAFLLEMSERPNIGIRVVPRSARAHFGLDGSFKIMTTPSGDVAYTESPGGGRLVSSTLEAQ